MRAHHDDADIRLLDFYGIPATPEQPTDEEIHFRPFIKTPAPGGIYRTGRHHWKVIRRVMPGIYLVAPYRPWMYWRT